MEAGDYNIQSSSTAPCKCIISNCNELLCSSTILSHLLSIHQKNDNVEFQEIFLDEKVLMLVSTHESFLQLNQTVCLGILGVLLESDEHNNALLKDEFTKFSHHIPILIMAYRGNYGDMYSSASSSSSTSSYDADNDYVCFWLVTPELKKSRKLGAILTIHDEDHNNAVSTTVETRRINSCQRVDEFIRNQTDFLVINAAMLQNIANEDSVFLEVIVKDKLY